MSLLWLVLLPLSPSLPGWSPLPLHSPSPGPWANMLADPSPSSPLALTKEKRGGGEGGEEGGVDSWCVNILAPILSPLWWVDQEKSCHPRFSLSSVTLFLPPLLGLGRSPGCRQWAEYINSIAKEIKKTTAYWGEIWRTTAWIRSLGSQSSIMVITEGKRTAHDCQDCQLSKRTKAVHTDKGISSKVPKTYLVWFIHTVSIL